MKFNISKLIYLLGFVFLFSSCESFIEGYDQDPNNPLEVPPSLLLPTAEVTAAYAIGGQVTLATSVWMQQHAGVSRQAASFGRYVAAETDFGQWEESIYPGALNDLYQLRLIADANGYNHYSGVADIFSAYILGVVTDMWGDVPFDECFQPEVTLTPAYQSQEGIYDRVIALLDSGIAKMSEEPSGLVPTTDDFIFGGDATSWIKFANSIKARQLLNLSATSKYSASAVLDAAAAGITDNAEDAMFVFGEAANEQHPMYQFEVNRNSDTRMGAFLIDMMNESGDPRLPQYAQLDGAGGYSGAVAGVEDESVSQLGPFYVSPASPVPLVTNVEMKFVMAEVNFREGNAGTAATNLNDALAASMAFFGVDGTDWLAANTYDADNISLDEILTQKYIALYQQPQVFNDWRRTGIPSIQPSVDNTTNNNIPTRFLYPQTEKDYNPNMPADLKITDKVWWDQ